MAKPFSENLGIPVVPGLLDHRHKVFDHVFELLHLSGIALVVFLEVRNLRSQPDVSVLVFSLAGVGFDTFKERLVVDGCLLVVSQLDLDVRKILARDATVDLVNPLVGSAFAL